MKKQLQVSGIMLSLAMLSHSVYALPNLDIVSPNMEVQAKSKSCKGVVVDSKGEPVIGASVQVKGTTNGVQTDFDGKFTINNVSNGAVILVKFIGYVSQEVTFNGSDLKITLQEDTKQLDEVVVVGYGTQKKVNVTGAVSSVGEKELASRPVQNVSQALQGAVPGLNFSVTNGGGALNSKMSFNVRGAGTIGSGSNSSPLVLIDGTEGDLNSISPSDIENISILKDASSSAIYGSRAAFGVILVTTKSGKSGRNSFTYNGSMRFSTATQIPKMLDSYRFAQYFNKALANKGEAPYFSEETLAKIKRYMDGDRSDDIKYGTEWNTNKNEWKMYDGGSWANTDWFAEMYRKNAPAHEHNMSFSGGAEKFNYYLSGSILDQRGLIRYGEDIFGRYNFNGKFTAKVASWLSITYNNKWVREDYKRPSYMTGLFFHNIARRWPVNAVVDPNGHLIQGQETIQMKYGGEDKTQKDMLNQQIVFEFTPTKDLLFRAEGNYNTTTLFNHWDKLAVYKHDKDGVEVPTSWEGSDTGESIVHESAEKINYYNGRFYAQYQHLFDKHDVKVIAGLDMELNQYRNLGGNKKDLITSDVPTINTATNDKPTLGGGYSHWATMGMFARINYAYDERYLAEFSIRRDGSSRFIGDKTWGTFPSFSLGWNLTNESFMEVVRKYTNLIKFRGSWGMLGNTNIEALYPWFLAMPTGTANSSWLINGERLNTSNAPGIVSSALTWERVMSWNVGLDFAAFNNRLQGSFDFFNRKTLNMVGPSKQLPSVLGTAQPALNNSDMLSYGWELEMKWNDAIGDFNYGLKFNISDDTQKVTRFYNPTNSLNTWYEGKIRGEIWGYTTQGIAKTNEEMTKWLEKNKPTWGANWAAGDVMYKDMDGKDGVGQGAYTLENHGDLTIIGNSMPHYNFGFTANAEWKGIDFSIFLQGVGKRDFWDNSPYSVGANHGIWQSAAFEEHWDFFRPEGDPLGANLDAHFPRPLLDAGSKNFAIQTRFLQDASYMRIKNMQLGYSLPKSWVSKIKLQRLRIYTSVDNLYTFTKLNSIFDPEATGGDWGAGKIYPLSRVWSFGVNINI